jgi:GNAT superfamily N-acetyltransferase
MPDDVSFSWRGVVGNEELNALHAEGFDHPVLDDDWDTQLTTHSLGWVTARAGSHLVGFVNVAWDGGVHAFLLDTLTRHDHRHRGIATRLVQIAVDEVRAAGCEWLHVDWDEALDRLYVNACGFEPAPAGLIQL